MSIQFSQQWLREWVDLPTSNDTLLEQFTQLGLEVESCSPVSGSFTTVVVAKVCAVSPHPNADRLKVCEVDAGTQELLTIVCGANNIQVNKKYPLALVGAMVGEHTIKPAKLRGVTSQGMLCSATELGLANTSDCHGILLLPDSAPVGQPLADYLMLEDSVIELAVTPDRGDCLSILGLSREIAAFNQLPTPALKQESNEITKQHHPVIEAHVMAKEACPRYLCRSIDHIKTDIETPIWINERLRRSGLRSVSLIVDVLNYVMLETGQPLHAFDAEKIRGSLKIRYANPQESITLLDETILHLDSKTLVIADSHQPIAVAGIMGGLEASVTEETRCILLESAHFSPITIAYAARHYTLLTEAAYRFERGVDPMLPKAAIERATHLLLSMTPGNPGPIFEATQSAMLPKPSSILLRCDRVRRVLGLSVELTDKVIADLLKRLNMQVSSRGAALVVTPPSYRLDLSTEIDLIEEVIRLYGYDALTSQPLTVSVGSTNQLMGSKTNALLEDRLRLTLTQQGYDEVITYSFIDPYWKRYLLEEIGLMLDNPISHDMSFMRTTLWPGLLKTALYNEARQQKRIRLFEVGQCFVAKNPLPNRPDAIEQTKRIAGLIMGSAYPEQWGYTKQQPIDFFDSKGIVEHLLALVGKPEDWPFERAKHPLLHAPQSAKILSPDGLLAGYIGQLCLKAQKELAIPTPVYLFELSIDALNTLRQSFSYIPPSKYPSIRRDVAVVVSEATSYHSLRQIILKQGGSLLKSIRIFDIYKKGPIKPGYKSLAIGLIFQRPERTLIEQEVDQIVLKIVKALEKNFDAIMRN